MGSIFSIDQANAGKWQPGDAAPVNTTPTQPVPVAAPVSGQPAQPTADLPPGTAPVAAGVAPGPVVPTVAQARAGVPVAVVQPMPPQQQGATPAQPTLPQRAGDIIARVSQGFGRLIGAGQNPTVSKNSIAPAVGIDRNFASVVSPAAQAAIDADRASRAAAPNIFTVRKQDAIARNY